jgi:hypothetical protein
MPVRPGIVESLAMLVFSVNDRPPASWRQAGGLPRVNQAKLHLDNGRLTV